MTFWNHSCSNIFVFVLFLLRYQTAVRSTTLPHGIPLPSTLMFEPVDVPEELLEELREQAADWAVANGMVIIKKSEPGSTCFPDILSIHH